MSSSQILTFESAHRQFAIPLADVREVLRAVAVTPLPGAPSVVEGVVDVRGDLLPVLDLRRRMGFPKRAVSPSDHFIVTMSADRLMILWVDQVHALVALPAGGADPKPELAPGSDYVSGIARLEDGMVLIHDVARFLAPTEEVALEDALRQFGTGGGE